MNEQNDFWGDTPDWTESADRPSRQRRADATRPSARPGTFGGKLKNLWGSAMSTGADATREHRVLDATQPHSAPAGMFDDFDDDFIGDFDGGLESLGRGVPDPAPHAPTTQVPTVVVSADAASDETFDVGPTGWSGDEWFADDVEIDDFAPVHAADQPAERRSVGIDPLLTRIGAAIVVTTLLVPLAVGLNSDGGTSDFIASAEIAATADEPVIELTPVETDQTASAVEPQGDAYLDPSQLPPAIPVNPDPSDESAASASSATDDSEPAEATAATDEASASIGADEMSTRAATGDDSTSDGAAADSGAIAAPVDAADTAERIASICATEYTVVDGDFWIRLADASGVELAELLEANDATVNTPLYPGSEICLPAGATTPAPPTTVAPAPEATTTTSTTSTTTTSTTSTTTTTVPSTPAGPQDIEQIIRDVWPDELEDRALEIAYRESRYVPTAKNYCCYGLFQIYWSVHQSWLGDIGITDDQQLYDPETNARAAYALYERAGGWGPWAL